MTLSRRGFLLSVPAGAAAMAVAGPAFAQESSDPIQVRWSRPFPRLAELAVSADGQRIAGLSLDGVLACFDLGGSQLWQRPSVEADGLAIAPRGDLLVAWPRYPRDKARLLLFNGAGRCFEAPTLPGLPASVAVSADGKRVAAAVGDGVALFGISPKGMISRSIKAAGAVKRLIAGLGDTFVVVTDPPCRIALIKSRGTELWRRDLPEDAGCSVAVSSDGKLLALAYEKSRDEIEILLTSWKNEEVWRASRPGRDGSVRMSGAGGTVFLAYDHLVEHQQQSRYERRLAYLGEGGIGGWTKGGALTAPLPVALDSRGDWLVALDNDRSRNGSRFRLYGKDGSRRWIYTAPSGIHLAVASADGRTIATYQADTTLSVLRVNTPDRRG